MEWSNFIFKFNKDNNVILFNTYNKATVLLNNKDYKSIDMFLKGEEVVCNKDYVRNLEKMSFIVKNKNIEREKFYEQITSANSSKGEKFNLVILTTTNCNFKCPYCYENGIFRGNSFSVLDINKIINIIDTTINANEIKNIQLTLFGGEPTLNWNFTVELLNRVNNYCNDNRIKLATDIITNGYLLDNNKISTLIKYNVNNIQITLDGKAEIHDKRRILINGKGTFNQIINNIDNILETDIDSITIRINYDANNAEKVLELIEFLDTRFFEKKSKIKLSFGRIDANLVNNNEKSILGSENQLDKYYLAFYKKALELGFRQEKYFETDSICMAKKENSLIISPDNKLYKCLSLVGIKDGEVGNFINDTNSKKLKNYFNIQLYDKCFEKGCEFIPMCHTGCRYEAFIKYGSLNLESCEYNLLKKINTEIIKCLYRL